GTSSPPPGSPSSRRGPTPTATWTAGSGPSRSRWPRSPTGRHARRRERRRPTRPAAQLLPALALPRGLPRPPPRRRLLPRGGRRGRLRPDRRLGVLDAEHPPRRLPGPADRPPARLAADDHAHDRDLPLRPAGDHGPALRARHPLAAEDQVASPALRLRGGHGRRRAAERAAQGLFPSRAPRQLAGPGP